MFSRETDLQWDRGVDVHKKRQQAGFGSGMNTRWYEFKAKSCRLHRSHGQHDYSENYDQDCLD